MNMKTIGKVSLKVLGLALPLVMSLVDAKNHDAKMKEEIAKGIEEALKTQAKGS